MPLDVVFRESGWLHARAWAAEWFDFWAFDRHVDALVARGEPLVVTATDDDTLFAEQLAIRTQRVAATRNRASTAPWFDRVLAEHRALHDISKPLVLADLDHALDTWQWTLRLDPYASAAVQLAALLHDIERLVSEADARVEQHAGDYQAFKDAHARAGADLARDVLRRADAPPSVADPVCELVARHERTDGSPAIAALNDADALSFFSLNSAGYLAYFGAEQTAKKVAYTFARMSPHARPWLSGLRVPRFVAECLHRQRA